MIAAQGVQVSIGGRCIVRNVSLSAPDGAITGFLGPNGAGKTTTLRVLSGLMAPDSGRVAVDGNDVEALPDRGRSRLGSLPDAKGLYRRLTARENIAYFGQLHGMKEDAIRHRTEQLSIDLGLTDFLDRRTEGFSQGERVRTALARALIHDPHTLLLDEPTNGLDVASQRALRDFLRRCRASGKAVLLSTHTLADASDLCDRIAVVARGTVVAEGTPDDLLSRTGTQNLEDAFVILTANTEEATA